MSRLATASRHRATAIGRAWLAALPPEEREQKLAIYRKDMPRAQWAEIQAGIDRAVRDYERYGFCLSVGEWNKDVWAVGTPMISREGGRILAFNCSGPLFDITRQRIVVWGRASSRCATGWPLRQGAFSRATFFPCRRQWGEPP